MTTQLIPDRETALDIGYKATDWAVPIGEETYRIGLANWDIQVIERDGEPIGAAFFCGDEVHVSILPEWRGRWATRGLLGLLFAKDRVSTRVSLGHDHMYDILDRLGFKRQGDLLVKEH